MHLADFVRKGEHLLALTPPGAEGYSTFDEGTKGDMQVSTTMAFVRLLSGLMKDKSIGKRVVPIVPDEARTFGMDPVCTVRNIPSRGAIVHPS